MKDVSGIYIYIYIYIYVVIISDRNMGDVTVGTM